MLIKPNTKLLYASAIPGLECQVVAASAVDLAGVAPTEIHLVPIGKWEGYVHPVAGKKNIEVNPDHVLAAARHHALRKERAPKRDLVIDYEHQTLKGEKAPAAGWIQNLEARDNGLWATGIKWTAQAKKHIEDGEYRYISPVFAFGVLDKVTGEKIPMAVFQAGLTNEPFFDELEPLVSKDNSQQLFFITKETVMDELLERLKYFLNLPLTATKEAIAQELEKLLGQVRQAMNTEANAAVNLPAIIEFLKARTQELATISASYKEALKAAGLAEDAQVAELKSILIAAKGNQTELSTLTQRVQELEAETLSGKVKQVLAEAFKAGKIVAVNYNDKDFVEQQFEIAKKDFSKFEGFWAKQPVIAPVQRIPSGGVIPAAGDLTETDLTIAKALGVSQEDLKKYNPAQN